MVDFFAREIQMLCNGWITVNVQVPGQDKQNISYRP